MDDCSEIELAEKDTVVIIQAAERGKRIPDATEVWTAMRASCFWSTEMVGLYWVSTA